MNKVKNKHGIKMYWEFAIDINKINILDSKKNYFNDLYYETNTLEELKDIIDILENTTLESMCEFFNAKLYNTLEELRKGEENDSIQLNNEYLNIFNIENKKYYTWSN